MFESLDGAIRSWIAGLTDALLTVGDRLRAPRRFVLRRESGGTWEIVPDAAGGAHSGVRRRMRRGAVVPPADGAQPARLGGQPIGRIIETVDGVRLEPPLVLTTLKGAIVRAVIPAGWIFRRALDPVSVKTAPYLDGFVRHHIERVTPWRVNDTYYTIITAPLAGDAERMSVEIAVVARDLVARSVGLVAASAPRRLLLEPEGDEAGTSQPIEVPLPSGEASRVQRLRQVVGVVVAALVVVLVTAISVGSWYQGYLDDRIADLDRDIGERRAFLAAAAARQGRHTTNLSRPELLKASEPAVVALIDTLSAILPDHAYLTDLRLEARRIRITGVSKDVAGLIPVIERSGYFTEVTFFAPTTRLPNVAGDRFYIEMRIKPQASQPQPETKQP